ncbi:MAG: PhnD/SsuA/transferrin family substrate-binding protein [Anaerolineales bacterium]
MVLRFTSCQAPNADVQFGRVVDYVGHRLGIEPEFVSDHDWEQREAGLFAGDFQVGWICGLPYVRQADSSNPSVAVLAAPLMAGARYAGEPVYFSDVVVRHDREFRTFNDLRGRTWAYNEPHSHSGYNLTRYMLAAKGLNGDYFGRRVEAGSHENALRLLLSGKIDATALDSTVLETELSASPQLADQLRILEAWGPSPIPPWVVHVSVPLALRTRLHQALTQMHMEPEGKAMLESAGQSRFVAVIDRQYDPIREMYRRAEPISL